jgi:hypothetical protein
MSYKDLELVREAQWRRAEKDPVYFANAFGYISNPLKGRMLMDTSERPYQEEGFSLLSGSRGRKVITLKARQVGWTTTCAMHSLWESFFQNDRYTLFISRRELDAKDILRKADYAWKYLPDWMRLDRGPRRVDDAAQIMTFDNDSIIRSEQSRSDPARGQTATKIIADEFASLPDQEESWASMEPVADLGGTIFILSTAKGMGNLFHVMVQGARLGTNGFHFVFIPWSAVPQRDEQWFAEKQRDLLPWIRAQEYPADPDEAFISSGNMVFDLDALRAQEVNAKVREYLGVVQESRPTTWKKAAS